MFGDNRLSFYFTAALVNSISQLNKLKSQKVISIDGRRLFKPVYGEARALMYNPESGGCFDCICRNSENLNQGGESSISYLLARLKLEELKQGSTSKRRRKLTIKKVDENPLRAS